MVTGMDRISFYSSTKTGNYRKCEIIEQLHFATYPKILPRAMLESIRIRSELVTAVKE